MTVRIVAKEEDRGGACFYCVEVAPQRILYELSAGFPRELRFSLALPWTYVGVSFFPRRTVGYPWGNDSDRWLPRGILASHDRLTDIDAPAGIPPLLGLSSEGSMCPGPLKVPPVSSPVTEKKNILAAVAAAFASGGQISYFAHLRQNQAFRYLQNAAKVGSRTGSIYDNPYDLQSNYDYNKKVFIPTYSYWESLGEFPSECPLDDMSLSSHGFTNLLARPRTLVK